VADDQERRGDAFSAREAARVIGELQSRVTRLTDKAASDQEERDHNGGFTIAEEEASGLPLDGQ
jgi:hypothetical protein